MNRVERLKAKMLKAEHAKHRIVMPEDWSVKDLPLSLVERKAHALKLIFKKMPVFIDEDELIVGSRTVFGCKKTEKGKKGIDLSRLGLAVYPAYATEEEKLRFGNYEGVSKGHFVPGFRKVLELGIGGIIKKAGLQLENESLPGKKNFLKGVIIAYEGISILARRFAVLALELSKGCLSPRREELHKISAVCRHISTEPPGDFHEALQLYWFIYLGLITENYTGICFGRFDQFMEPYYSSMPAGEAFELLECLLVKLNDQADIKLSHVRYAGSDNIVISGTTPDGKDATNELTYAVLDGVGKLRLVSPQTNVRIHKNSPEKLVKHACDLARQGLNNMAFYNDDVIIKSLVSVGFPLEDARDYALDLCQDILIEGKSDFFLGGEVSMTRVLLDLLDSADENIGFEALLHEYKRAIARKVKAVVKKYNTWESATTAFESAKEPFPAAGGDVKPSFAASMISPLPFLSATLDNCIEKGLDINRGGLKYRDKGIFLTSPVNAVNSLAAIKKVVFEQKQISLSKLRLAYKSNYEGWEILLHKLLAAPKWGNDDDYVDLLAKDVFEFGLKEILKYRTASGARFLSGIHQPHTALAGKLYAATPDGRRAGEPLPVTLSPANGTDINGPTAVLKSVSKIDPLLCQWNSALTLRFHPIAVRGNEGLAKFKSLLETFFSLGGIELQTNIFDTATLRAAQKEPEKYKTLIVRIWGMSAYFINISREFQEEIISRAEHGL